MEKKIEIAALKLCQYGLMSTGCPETALTTMLLPRMYATTLEMMHEYGPDAAQYIYNNSRIS